MALATSVSAAAIDARADGEEDEAGGAESCSATSRAGMPPTSAAWKLFGRPIHSLVNCDPGRPTWSSPASPFSASLPTSSTSWLPHSAAAAAAAPGLLLARPSAAIFRGPVVIAVASIPFIHEQRASARAAPCWPLHRLRQRGDACGGPCAAHRQIFDCIGRPTRLARGQPSAVGGTVVRRFPSSCPIASFAMDPNMKQLQEALVDIETDAEQLLLARHQLVENDKMRNANREALTALRKRARTTKTSVPSPFEVIMKEMEGTSGMQLVKEICPTCGNYDPKEHTWLMFPGSDIFARVPFHVAHTVLDKDQERLDYDTKKLHSFVKEKSFVISEKGALADKISPGIVKSLVSLTDKSK